MHSIKRWLAPLAVGLFTMIGASTAQAAQELYPKEEGARTLNNGSAGYTGSTSAEGLCVPLLLCPAVSNDYESSGGVGGSGYIRTRLGSLTGVGATSSGIWTSAAFTYEGVAGAEADDLAFKLSRRADVEALLAVAGTSATYSVELVGLSGAKSVSIVDRDSLAGLAAFTEKSFALDASALELGARYRIRITSRFESGVQVLPGGSADYDDVRISASVDSSTGGGGNGNGTNGGNGGNGGNGANGGNGNGGNGSAGNGAFGGSGFVADPVRMRGSKLLVKVRCAKQPKSRCKVRADARLKRGGPRVTNKRTARVAPGKKRTIALQIKPRFVSELERRKRIGVKASSKNRGEKTTRAYRVMRIKHG